MSQGFTNHFGAIARQYVDSRPRYPAALFAWCAAHAPARDLAWDCGTGSGQVAAALADHFGRVFATDASAAQLAQAPKHARIAYARADASHSSLAAGRVSLVTVGQALHWFAHDGFYGEVRRVLRPDGLVAAFTYAALRLENAAAERVIRDYHYGTLESYWPAERADVENGYRDLAFPFTRVAAPAFAMTEQWTVEQLCGYLRSWSGTARYAAAHGADPVIEVERRLRAVWGHPDVLATVTWPLTVLVGRV